MGVNISVDKDLEALGGQVGLSQSDLHAAAYQFAGDYGEQWRAKLAASLLPKYLDKLALVTAQAKGAPELAVPADIDALTLEQLAERCGVDPVAAEKMYAATYGADVVPADGSPVTGGWKARLHDDLAARFAVPVKDVSA